MRSLPVCCPARFCLALWPEVHLCRAPFLLRAEGKVCRQGMLQSNGLLFTPQAAQLLFFPLSSLFSVSKALTSLVIGSGQRLV